MPADQVRTRECTYVVSVDGWIDGWMGGWSLTDALALTS